MPRFIAESLRADLRRWPNAFRIFTGCANGFVPKGHPENSPAFQRWVQGQRELRPEGTVELMPQTLPVSRPFGTDTTDDGLPALKRRAIFNHPSGMMPAAGLRIAFANFRKALAWIFRARRSRRREEADGRSGGTSPPLHVGGYGLWSCHATHEISGLGLGQFDVVAVQGYQAAGAVVVGDVEGDEKGCVEVSAHRRVRLSTSVTREMGLREMRSRRALNSAADLPALEAWAGTILSHGLPPLTTRTDWPEWTRFPSVSKLSAASCFDTVLTSRSVAHSQAKSSRHRFPVGQHVVQRHQFFEVASGRPSPKLRVPRAIVPSGVRPRW